MTRPRYRAATAGVLLTVALAACSSAEDVADDSSSSSQTTSAAASTTAEPTDPVTPSTMTATPAPSGALPGFGTGPAGKGIKRFYDQQVSWTACEDDTECADIWVPLDYSDPDGTAITLKAKRDPADDPSKRLGSLFVNPGGPGEPGLDLSTGAPVGDTVRDAYDVVGFDPRGVGSSTPIECLTDAQRDEFISSDPTPDTPDEVTELEDLWRQYTDGCQEKSGALLGHVSTVEVARDLDVMRGVVGDDKLSYLGFSYGTFIGATYAGLFPDNVGRMVLDGAVDPLAKPLTTQLNQTAGFQKALEAYLAFCVDKGDCPLGDSVDAAQDRLIQLLADIDAQPLPTSSGRELTEGLAFYGVILPLYSEQLWPTLTLELQQAMQGKGDGLLAVSDLYTDRGKDGTYANNSTDVQAAVNCLDRPQDESLQDIEADRQQFLQRSPVFGPAGMWFPYACSHWPLKAAEPLPDFAAKGAAPIVVVGTTRDPATPYQQSVRLAQELESGVLLSRDGDGHTAYGSGNDCIDDALDAYLATGKVPTDGTRC
jgi:pimeloyl-ACP methyl ester carboxylesterase